MRYAINFNLDYENNPQEIVRAIYRRLHEALLAAGFRPDGRIFTIDLPEREACELARRVVEQVNDADPSEPVYGYIKAFYGFDFANVVNLLVPSTGSIDVEEVADQVEEIDLAPPTRDPS